MTIERIGSTEIEYIQGNVYDAKTLGADGLIVFYYGLSAIRVTASKHSKDDVFNASFKCARYIDTDMIQVNDIQDMRTVLEYVFRLLMVCKCHTIVMNGIRVRNRPDIHNRPEKYQIQFIKEWLSSNPDVFEKVMLVDRRDGFNHANDRI